MGILGHRPDRLTKTNRSQLEETILGILREVKTTVQKLKTEGNGLYNEEEPIFRALSPLAEGSDRHFAKQALSLGYKLCCVLPFAKEEYLKDFASDETLENHNSIEAFEALFDQRDTQFVMDGIRLPNSSEAYAACGAVVANQADLLITVWDGKQGGRKGGTEDTMHNALRSGVPIAWIDALEPENWQILTTPGDIPKPQFDKPGERSLPDPSKDRMASLVESINDALLPPESKQASLIDPPKPIARFYKEKETLFNFGILWNLFRSVILLKFLPTGLFSKTYEEEVLKEWPSESTTPLDELINALRPYYAWTDMLSVHYANKYRSAFIFAYLLAAAAVGMALIPLGLTLRPHGGPETVFIALELLFILVILLMIFFGRKNAWHERWIDYRLTAELVRHLKVVLPLGGGSAFPQIPAQWASYGQPGASWMAWYVRAIERELGLPDVRLDNNHLEASLENTIDLLKKQEHFHETNAHRCHTMEHRLHIVGMSLLSMTLVFCIIHFIPGLMEFGFHTHVNVFTQKWSNLLTFLCGFLPALGAGIAAISNQGEFLRLSKRSKAMQQELASRLSDFKLLHKRIKNSNHPAEEQYSTQAAQKSGEAARLLINEVLDWRVVFTDQPLKPPA